jgi:hypothetical protein
MKDEKRQNDRVVGLAMPLRSENAFDEKERRKETD